jgi:hypothetical protein
MGTDGRALVPPEGLDMLGRAWEAFRVWQCSHINIGACRPASDETSTGVSLSVSGAILSD